MPHKQHRQIIKDPGILPLVLVGLTMLLACSSSPKPETPIMIQEEVFERNTDMPNKGKKHLEQWQLLVPHGQYYIRKQLLENGQLLLLPTYYESDLHPGQQEDTSFGKTPAIDTIPPIYME